MLTNSTASNEGSFFFVAAARLSIMLLAGILAGSALISETHAQYFGFGKNRVQYSQFDWRFIQSDHFDVYYYDSKNYYLAEFTAKSLEAAYAQLSSDFRHQLNDRIAVIIYDSHTDFSQTNVVPLPVDAQGIGGVTDKIKNRITIPFMGHYGDYRQVLHHELVHAMFNDKFYGGTIQSIIQNNIQLRIPLWFEEGLAEYVSLGWDTDTDMFIRDAVMNNNMPPIPMMRGFMAYRGGQAFWNFIVEEYGREKIGEILHRVRQTRSVESGLRQSLGISMSDLNDRFHDWLRKMYFPEIAVREDLRDIGRLMTDGNFRRAYNTSPAVSPNGDRIAMISNARGYFDVVVLNARDGSKIKTLIKGEDNVDFEELNILRPNLSWSPDGRKITLSTRSGGSVDLAIVDYQTGDVQKILFPQLDDIGSVSWSPDGKKIAFQGNNGPLTNIYVYDLEEDDFFSATNDVFSDWGPSWSPDSEYLLFASDRGSHTRVNTFRSNYNVLLNPNIGQSDIYRLRIGSSRAERLTSTPNWNESRPIMTREGRLLYISDQNGIPNVYEMDLETRASYPLTDLITGVMQMSVSADGRLLAINSYNRGFVHIFTIENPMDRRKDEPLENNNWAERRLQESKQERVPAVGLAFNMFQDDWERMRTAEFIDQTSAIVDLVQRRQEEAVPDQEVSGDLADMLPPDDADDPDAEPAAPDTEEPEEDEDEDVVDFRNYVFGDDVDDFIRISHVEERESERQTITEDGRFIPRRYRLDFSPDISYGAGGVSTFYGTYAMAAFSFSDLLGDHRIELITNLQFDLRNSDYQISYGYFANRTNYIANYFHTARNFRVLVQDQQTGALDTEQVRFRYYGGGIRMQYPLNKFTRIDYGINMINISRDFSRMSGAVRDSEDTYFFNPEVTFTRDLTRPGFLSPLSGYRYALSVSGSPPIASDVIGFASVLGDFRRYFHLGSGYVFAFRGSGAASFGPDSQNFYMGGMQNWINFRWAEGGLQTDRLEDVFFTLPALPMRGHFFNSALGNRFGLFNAEFRFPLIAAMLPGPIPIIPLYNIQGAAFVDVGAAWDGSTRDAALAGAGFGLRTILLGLPFRYDIAWPYDMESGDGFGRRVHYFSIGLDF
ncbi:peptidase MA family metallohydrolase [Natronogracilivirga saccharolytica]|uniref:PD40 domain-containing protein n=1 Tax=Natronogracilivirga saccharolytica TaxID=2812953 RepID=A0A8J7UUE7_9BACT|nr:PD40 domain-containing protein [Natronogracilivirga saccharolytica]MBP3192350.1 PD40 domain-containing protein [Natronogracilivirga saccharolytica]